MGNAASHGAPPRPPPERSSRSGDATEGARVQLGARVAAAAAAQGASPAAAAWADHVARVWSDATYASPPPRPPPERSSSSGDAKQGARVQLGARVAAAAAAQGASPAAAAWADRVAGVWSDAVYASPPRSVT